MKIHQYSENVVSVYLGDEISPNTNQTLVRLKQAIEDKNINGLIEVVLSYTSLAIEFDLIQVSAKEIINEVKSVNMEKLKASKVSYNIVEIPVCYGGEYGPDIHLFESSGLSESDVIDTHSGKEYLVYMLGFMPGFPFLGGLDESLYKDRLSQPRKSIPKGSVGIGGKQTGMYPFDSPGGWNLIGRTPVPLFDEKREPEILYRPGDRIIYRSISEEEYKEIESKIEAGTYTVPVTKCEV